MHQVKATSASSMAPYYSSARSRRWQATTMAHYSCCRALASLSTANGDAYEIPKPYKLANRTGHDTPPAYAHPAPSPAPGYERQGHSTTAAAPAPTALYNWHSPRVPPQRRSKHALGVTAPATPIGYPASPQPPTATPWDDSGTVKSPEKTPVRV